MKKIILSFTFTLLLSTVFAKPQLILTSNLDDKSMPVDNLETIPFVKDREYLMFMYDDANVAFNTEKMYFEISIYEASEDKYKYSALYFVDTKTDWGYCYKGITFSVPMKLKIKVFTNAGELVTRYVNVE